MLLLLTGCTGFPQGFVNLNFESAKILPISGGNYGLYSIASTNALPGWTVYFGAVQQTQITYNDPAIGSTFVTLWATNGQNISGNYSVLLQGGLGASAATISQTALTPIGAESILFKAQYSGPIGLGEFLVSMNGQNIPLTALSSGSNYTLYGGDVSGYAGQTAQLNFSAPNLGHDNDWNLDDIVFSSSPIPEPSSFALFGVGALLLSLFRQRSDLR